MSKKSKWLKQHLERNRTSIFSDDLVYCYFCGKPRDDIHEILYGTNRLNSMKFGFVLPLCREHHRMFHDNRQLTNEWAKKCQKWFEREYSLQDWMDIFHRNYL